MKSIVMLSLSILAATAVSGDPTGDPDFKHPAIDHHGGIVALPAAAEQPQKNSKVILDITSVEKSGSVIKGLDRAALILNQYSEAGAGMDHGFKMAIVLHGPATKAALSQEAYAKHTDPYLTDKKTQRIRTSS